MRNRPHFLIYHAKWYVTMAEQYWLTLENCIKLKETQKWAKNFVIIYAPSCHSNSISFLLPWNTTWDIQQNIWAALSLKLHGDILPDFKKKRQKKHHKLIVVHHIMRLLKPYHRFVSKRELWNLICNYGKYKKALFDLLDVNAIGSHISPDQSGNRKFNKNSF